MVNLKLQITQPNHVIIPEIGEFPASTAHRQRQRRTEFPSIQLLLTMLSIIARPFSRPPPLTLALRPFSSSSATRQAVPTETKPLNKEFKIYRWVPSSLLF